MARRTPLDTWLRKIGPADGFRGLAELLPDAAVFAVDADRNIVFWSDGAERLLGFPAEDVLGEHCLKANRCHRCMVGCGIAMHGSINAQPLILYRADGVPTNVRKTARAFYEDDGGFAGGVEVLWPARDGGATAGIVPLPAEAVTFHGLTSVDPAMHAVFQVCRNVGETEASALVRGESGTGKELIARALHAESTRRGGPFVAVNCAALTPSLMESELFGHVRGAFTGAVQDREGIFARADGGTLFLDEVAELPLSVQAKLLRVLEQREVLPVGSAQPVEVDARVIAATHRSLREEVAAGRFREDLMYRLRVVPIFLPPLRDRRRDVEVLLWRFIGERNVSGPRVVDAISPHAMRALLEHAWPGNVRELRNVVEYAFAVGRGPELAADELPPELRRGGEPGAAGAPSDTPGVAWAIALSDIPDEAERIAAAVQRAGGHLGRAAAALGVSRPTLWRKRKKYGL